MYEAISVARPGGWGLRERKGLGGEGRYLDRDRPTDRVDLHQLEGKKMETEREKA